MENSKNKINKILKSIPLLRGITDQDAEIIASYLEPLSYPADTNIIQEGSTGQSMFLIVNGSVRVTRGSKDDEVLIGHLYSGSFFGEFSLIDSMPRSANVISNKDVDIFQLTKNNFEKILEKDPNFSSLFYKNCLTETFYRFRNTVANFSFSQHTLHEKTNELDEINKDLSQAKIIQNYFINTKYLDSKKGQSDSIKKSYIYKPCIDIGGDFFNVKELDDNTIAVIIADVSGHGITAALATGVLKSAFNFLITDLGNDPVKFMFALNDHFSTVVANLFATCYYAVINKEKQTIKMVKAGHHHPLFWKSKDNTFVDIQCNGIGLGMMKQANFNMVELEYEKGDKILFFTDGIIEQMDPDEKMFDEINLRNSFKNAIERQTPQILHAIQKDLHIFAKDMPFEDDVTLVLLEML